MRSKSKVVLAALVAVFAFTAVAASSALASPEWYVKKAGVWEKVTEAVKVVGEGSWELIDTGNEVMGERGLEPLRVSCTSTSTGEIKPGGIEVITTRTIGKCTGHPAGCGTIKSSEGRNFPWKTELYKEGTTVRSRILSEVEGGKKTPEWKFTCSPITTWTDTCGVNSTTSTSNNASGYVEEAFDTKSNKTHCSVGGESKGEWKGSFDKVKASSGSAIKVE